MKSEKEIRKQIKQANKLREKLLNEYRFQDAMIVRELIDAYNWVLDK